MKLKAIVLAALFTAQFFSLNAGEPASPPFTLDIVPHQRIADTIVMNAMSKSNLSFYLVLTNQTEKAQPIFEEWTSWGYFNISFEATDLGGRKFIITKRKVALTRNFPSTYLIPPKGHYVYSIILNHDWLGAEALGKGAKMRFELRAKYSVTADEKLKNWKPPEGVDNEAMRVWTGSVTSQEISVEYMVM